MRVLAAACFAALALAGCSDLHTAENLRLAHAFMAANAKAPGVVTLPSGLEYKILRAGAPGGASPTQNDQVLVQYEGRLLNGQVFDSSYRRGRPGVFTVGGLVPAWTEALQKMRPGDEWMVYAPPELGYGRQGAGPIPPNSALIFRIELLAILPADASVGKG